MTTKIPKPNPNEELMLKLIHELALMRFAVEKLVFYVEQERHDARRPPE